jgi:hypothetical protein
MGNVFWASAEPGAPITSVVDWDKTGVGPYGDEVVSAALVFFADQQTGLLDLDSVRAFIAGYLTARPQLNATEITASVHRVWWERLTDFWILDWRYQLEDLRSDSLFPGTAALVPWWTENYDKVLEAFADGTDAAPRPGRSGSFWNLDRRYVWALASSPLIASLTDTVRIRRT